MKISDIHVGIEVSDLERALAFYRPLLTAAGFDRTYGDQKTWAGFANGPFSLVIGPGQPPRVRRGKPTGNEFVVADHVGFTVERRADLERLVEVMAGHGVAPLFPAREYPEFSPGFWSVCFSDPDHNVIEFCVRPG